MTLPKKVASVTVTTGDVSHYSIPGKVFGSVLLHSLKQQIDRFMREQVAQHRRETALQSG